MDEKNVNFCVPDFFRIYALSSSELIGHQSIMGERRQNSSSAYEILLMQKWSNLLVSMINNRKRDEKIIGFVAKQIEYITFLFRAVLITKSAIIPTNNVSMLGKINGAEPWVPVATFFFGRTERKIISYVAPTEKKKKKKKGQSQRRKFS